MADSIESQKHFMEALKSLASARRELMSATSSEVSSSWEDIFQEIDIAMLGISKRSRI